MGVLSGLLQKTALVAVDAFLTGIATKKAQDYSIAVLEKQAEIISKIPDSPKPIQQAHQVAVKQPKTVITIETPGAVESADDREWESAPNPYLGSSAPLEMPTTEETIAALKQRLTKELYRVELDLQGGGRIAGKPCDCLSKHKHSVGIEATAEELMSYEYSPLYQQIIDWFNQHGPEFDPSEIAKHEPGYYQAMAPEIRDFRKQL